MIAGQVRGRTRTRYDLARLAMLTGQWSKVPDFAELMGDDPLPIDTRWATPSDEESDRHAEARLEREQVAGEAQASEHGHIGSGYLTDEELERAYAEARIL